MNPLEYIQQYTKPLSEAANMLRQLASPLMPLPGMEHLQSIKERLLEIHPADVTAKLAWEDKVESKRRFIIDGLQGFLNIDAGVGVVLIDGVEYDYWDGMNDKLAMLDKAEVEAYTNLIVAISNIIHDSTNGMRHDINYLFNEIVFEDRNILATNPDAHRVDDSLNLPPDLNTERARKYFQRAIDAGFIRRTAQGLEWIKSGKVGEGVNAQAALFLGMVYCGDEVKPSKYGNKWKLGNGIFPDAPLKRLFALKTLGTIRTNDLDGDRCKSAPRGWERIVDIFE